MSRSSDNFWTVVTISRVLSQMLNNMREGAVQLQQNYHGTLPGGSPLQGNLPAIQQAVRDQGLANQQILDKIAAAYLANPTELQAAAVAPLPTFADLQADYQLLNTWATNKRNATFTTAADLDNAVGALLAAIPPSISPY